MCCVCFRSEKGMHSGDGCVSSSILFKYGTFVCSELAHGRTGCSGKCCFAVMYCEWYGILDFVVVSVVVVVCPFQPSSSLIQVLRV